jgi:hypothetical protein
LTMNDFLAKLKLAEIKLKEALAKIKNKLGG